MKQPKRTPWQMKVEVTGFDTTKEGRQTITVHYKGASTSFDVLVNPKPALNDEYHKQKLAEAEGKS